MEIPISQARQRLPELVRQVKANHELQVLITVHGDVAAELRAHVPSPPPGTAARRLQAVMAKLPPSESPETRVSENVNEVLYGKGSP